MSSQLERCLCTRRTVGECPDRVRWYSVGMTSECRPPCVIQPCVGRNDCHAATHRPLRDPTRKRPAHATQTRHQFHWARCWKKTRTRWWPHSTLYSVYRAIPHRTAPHRTAPHSTAPTHCRPTDLQVAFGGPPHQQALGRNSLHSRNPVARRTDWGRLRVPT